MKKFVLLLFALLAITAANACNPARSALKQLESFTNKIENKSDKWDTKDWDEAAKQFQQLSEEISNNEYSEEELQQIGKLQGRCGVQFVKHYAHTATQKLGVALSTFQAIIDGVLQGVETEMKK